jgi:hypothetical protein
MVKALIAALAAMALAGCTTTAGDFCDVAKPMRPSQAALAAMDGQEVAEMLRHNLAGQRLCGWRP